jgi:hypothetical protein
MCVWETKNAYRVLVGKPERKTPHERARHTWKIMLKWFLRKQGGRMWTRFDLVHDGYQWPAVVTTVMNILISK